MGAFDFLFNKQDKEPYQGESLDNKPTYNLADKQSRLVDQYRFLVLGAYGKKDKIAYNNVKQAISEMGYTDDVVFVRNNSEVIKFGVIDTPALVVDGKVVTYGKQFEVEDVKALFEKFNLK